MFIERLLKLINEKNITKSKLLSDLSLNKNSILNWQERGTVPSADVMDSIADYFNVSIDYLLGKTDIKEKSPNDITFDDFTYAMHNESKDLSDEDKEMLLYLARKMKNRLDEKKGK